MDHDSTPSGLPVTAVSSAEPLPVTTDLQDRDRVPDPNDRHFSTDHLLVNLKARTISSGLVTSAAQLIQFVLNLVSIMVLARLLTPKDFGLVAMATTMNGFLRIFADAGLSTATVQREGITHAQVSNLFWTNLAVGAMITLVLAACAPVLAWFYQEPRILEVTLVLSVTFFLASSGVQHMALLRRQMRFKVIAWVQVASMAAGVLVGIVMALLNYGFWSLVGLNLTTTVAWCLLTWSASRWRPQFPNRGNQTGPLLSFGTNIAAGQFMYSIARGTDGLLIGRFFGADAIGLYSRASVLLTRPLEQAFATLNSVFVPALSRVQAQPERYRRAFLQVYEAIALITFPVTALFLALANPVTLVVLGPKWEKAAVIFGGFTLVALYFPLFNLSSWLFVTQGRGRDSLVGFAIGSVIMVLSFAAGLPFGPAGVAIAYSVSCLLIQLPIRYYIAGRSGPITTTDLWMGFLRYLPLWGVVWATTYLARAFVINSAPLVQVAICTPIGLLVGIILICIVGPFRRRALSLIDALRSLRETGV